MTEETTKTAVKETHEKKPAVEEENVRPIANY
jgi:hypothetical protein